MWNIREHRPTGGMGWRSINCMKSGATPILCHVLSCSICFTFVWICSTNYLYFLVITRRIRLLISLFISFWVHSRNILLVLFRNLPMILSKTSVCCRNWLVRTFCSHKTHLRTTDFLGLSRPPKSNNNINKNFKHSYNPSMFQSPSCAVAVAWKGFCSPENPYPQGHFPGYNNI